MNDPTRYPLQWPVNVARTRASDRKRAAFKSGNWSVALSRLTRQLQLFGVDAFVLSTNQPLRNDGLPYAQTRSIEDTGAAVYFRLKGAQICLPCDRWLAIGENVRAITLHIQSVRAQGRYGVGTVEQAFAGYKALPSQAGEGEPWTTVLDLPITATREQIVAAHRIAALAAHPDRGGSADQMARINVARDKALAGLK